MQDCPLKNFSTDQLFNVDQKSTECLRSGQLEDEQIAVQNSDVIITRDRGKQRTHDMYNLELITTQIISRIETNHKMGWGFYILSSIERAFALDPCDHEITSRHLRSGRDVPLLRGRGYTFSFAYLLCFFLFLSFHFILFFFIQEQFLMV